MPAAPRSGSPLGWRPPGSGDLSSSESSGEISRRACVRRCCRGQAASTHRARGRRCWDSSSTSRANRTAILVMPVEPRECRGRWPMKIARATRLVASPLRTPAAYRPAVNGLAACQIAARRRIWFVEARLTVRSARRRVVVFRSRVKRQQQAADRHGRGAEPEDSGFAHNVSLALTTDMEPVRYPCGRLRA